MNKIAFIYALIDPRDYQVRYIGKTDDIRRGKKENKPGGSWS